MNLTNVDTPSEALLPLVTGWLGKIDYAIKAKKSFNEVSMQCMQFFSGAADFMWSDKYMSRYMGANMSPRFKVTIAKAFELVALFGPSLAWQWPQRAVRPRPRFQFDPQIVTQDQQQAQQIMQEEDQRSKRAEVRSQLLQHYLNYTPTEQPGGGLQEHMELATTESLVKGMGCLWPKSYLHNGSNRKLTGCFYDTVDNLFIDPDTEQYSGTLDDAWWIAQRCTEPVWYVERERGLPPGSLSANALSNNGAGEQDADQLRNYNYATGRSHDVLTYYKIWSRCGIGNRLADMSYGLKKALSETAGDYCYLEVAHGCQYPLNLTNRQIERGTVSDVERAMRWPIAFWADNRWPVQTISYYRKPRSPWPIAPMSQGLGELIALNILMSAWLDHIWDARLDIYACAKSAASKLRTVLDSQRYPSIVEIDDGVGESIDSIIKILQKPGAKDDIIKAMEMLMSLFERRTGINDLLQGFNPGQTQMRSAEEAKIKGNAVSVRPDFMRRKVSQWQAECARAERFVARFDITSDDVKGLFSPVGQYLWKTEIEESDPEEVIFETDVTVQADDLQKPNVEKDAANLKELGQILIPELAKHADVTGDTEPLNNFIEAIGESMQQEGMDAWKMGQRVPQPPPPDVAEQQRQLQQLEMDKLAAETEAKRADAAAKMASIDSAQQELQAKLESASLESQIKMQDKQLELQFKEQDAQANLENERAQSLLRLGLERQKGMQEIGHEGARFAMEMAQGRERFEMDMQQAEEKANQQLDTAKLMAKVKATQARKTKAPK